MSTVTVVATVETSNNPPRVRLDVTDTGTPNLFSTNVTRLDPDGRTVTVRTVDGNPLVLTASGSDRVGLLYDYEMPYGAPVTYSTVSTPGTTTTVTVPETRVWLIHPGVPELSMTLSVAEFGNRVRRVARGVHYPMGRKYPVVQTDGQRTAPEGVVQINTLTLDEMARFESLTEDGGVLLLNVPVSLGWGVPTSYVAVGDIEEARLVDYAGQPRRVHSLPFLTVDRPVGGSQSQRTLADLLVYPTLNDVMAAYSSLNALLAGP